MALSLDRLFETIVNQGVSEAWLVEGKPPLFRVGDTLHEGVMPPLTRTDVELPLTLKPHWLAAFKQRRLVEYSIVYGEALTHFRLTMVKVGRSSLALIRREAAGADDGAAHPSRVPSG